MSTQLPGTHPQRIVDEPVREGTLRVVDERLDGGGGPQIDQSETSAAVGRHRD